MKYTFFKSNNTAIINEPQRDYMLVSKDLEEMKPVAGSFGITGKMIEIAEKSAYAILFTDASVDDVMQTLKSGGDNLEEFVRMVLNQRQILDKYI